MTSSPTSPSPSLLPTGRSTDAARRSGRTRRRVLWLIGVALVAAIVAIGTKRQATATVVTPTIREVVDLVVVSGRLRAVREAAVGVEISGTVEEALVREGDRVAAGQPLARLALLDYEAQRAQASARRDTSAADAAAAALAAAQARSDLKRTEELSARGVSSPVELETARNLAARLAAVENAALARKAEDEGALLVLDRQLQKRIVQAPFAGVVTRRSVEPGQSVGPGTALYLVAEMAQTEIYAETDEANVSRLRTGQAATVIAPAYRSQPFPARLSQIGPRVDWDRGVVGLRLLPENAPEFLLPNMTVDVNIEVGRFPQAMTLPVSAVLRARDGNFVLSVQSDRFERRSVTVVGENPTSIAVTGLDPGIQVAKEVTKVKVGPSYRMSAAQ